VAGFLEDSVYGKEKEMKQVIFGLIGNPVKHSLSPLMQNAAFKHLGISAEYRLFEVPPEKLEGVLLGTDFVLDIEGEVSSKELEGFNITIPYKVQAREILEKKFPIDKKALPMQENLYYVQLSGAINTVKREEEKIKYWNTDASGFLRSLRGELKFETKDKNVLLIGCGGAGRSIIASLIWRQHKIKHIYITDISNEAIESAKRHFSQSPQYEYLEKKLKFISSQGLENAIKNCDLLVNATPVGMHDNDQSVVNKNWLHKNLAVYDIVYRKGNSQTQLIKDAEAFKPKLNYANGLDMLLYQGIDALELWIEKKAPVEIMKQALEEGVKNL